MADKVSKVAKPAMRGLLNGSIKINLISSIVLAGLSAVGCQLFLKNTRREKYAEYYKTYDPEAHFERLRKAGLLQSTS